MANNLIEKQATDLLIEADKLLTVSGEHMYFLSLLDEVAALHSDHEQVVKQAVGKLLISNQIEWVTIDWLTDKIGEVDSQDVISGKIPSILSAQA